MYAEFYRQDYRRLYLYEQTDRLDDEYLRIRGEFSAAEIRWQRYQPYLEPPEFEFAKSLRLLDAGAGLAAFSGLVAERLPEARVTAVEPDPTFAAFARRRWRIDVIAGWLESANLPPRSFSHAMLLHVLEHVEAPAEFLLGLNRLLEDRGYLFVEVPNIAGKWSGIGMLHPAHLTQFTPQTLRLIIERAGFEVLNVHAWDDGPLAPSISAVAVKRLEPSAPLHVEVIPPNLEAIREDFRERLDGATRTIRLARWKRRVAKAIGPRNVGRVRRVICAFRTPRT